MEQTILTKDQQWILKEFAKTNELRTFYLTGGTALAGYYLFHRDSDDLDFFSQNRVNLRDVQVFISHVVKGLKADNARRERVHDRHLFFLPRPYGELKIEFTCYPFASLEAPNEISGVRVDSLRDIAANKLAALLDRFEPKDFVDLYFLLQQMPLSALQKDIETKFSLSTTPLFLGSEFAKVRRIEALPRMQKPLSIEQVKQFFTKLAKSFEQDVLE